MRPAAIHLGQGMPQPRVQRWATDVTPHTLRHTSLTCLEEEGIPIELISKLAAHGGTDITRQPYPHARPEVLRPAAETMERAATIAADANQAA